MNDLLIWNDTTLSVGAREIRRLQQMGIRTSVTDHNIQIPISDIGVYRSEENPNQIYLSIRVPAAQEIIRINLDEDKMSQLHESIYQALEENKNMMFRVTEY